MFLSLSDWHLLLRRFGWDYVHCGMQCPLLPVLVLSFSYSVDIGDKLKSMNLLQLYTRHLKGYCLLEYNIGPCYIMSSSHSAHESHGDVETAASLSSGMGN